MQQQKQNNHQPTTNRQPHKTPHTQKHETNETNEIVKLLAARGKLVQIYTIYMSDTKTLIVKI